MSRTAVKVLAAAAVGFAAGLLLAPKSGEETLKDIKRKSREAKDYATEQAGRVKGAVTSGYETVREGAMDISDEVTGFMGHAEEAGDELAHDAKTRGKRVATKAESTRRKAEKTVRSNLK